MKTRIVIHCSAGPAAQRARDIVAYHLRPQAQGGRGWSVAGYHYIIEADGTVVPVVAEDRVANGAAGYNADSIHVCYTGGVDASGRPADTRTDAQKRALRALVADIRRRRPEIRRVVGHRDLSPDRNGNGRVDKWEWIKACPSFEVSAEFPDAAS